MNEGFASDCHTLYSPGLASSNKMALPDFYQVGAEIFRKVRIEQPDEWLNLALEPKTDERFIEKSKDLLGSDVEDIAHSIASQSIDDIVRRVDTYQAPLNIREVRVLKNGDRVPIVESNLGSYLYDEEVFWIFASLGFPDIVYEKSDIFTVAIKVKETKFNPFSHSHQMKSFTTKPSDTKTSGVDEAISWLNQNSHR